MANRKLVVAVSAGALFLSPLASAQQGGAAVTPPAADAGVAAEAQPPDVSQMPFTQDSIRQVMTFHQPRIQACYEEFLREKNKALEGKLTTAFTITAEGLVKNARVIRGQSSLKDGKLHDCVVAVLVSMNFPKPPGGKEQPVEYPFNLKAIK